MDRRLGLGMVEGFLLKDDLLSRQVISSTRELLIDTTAMITLSWEECVNGEFTSIF
jgi:hypothetical protein